MPTDRCITGRGIKSKIAAKRRRDEESAYMTELSEILPFPKEALTKLDKGSILKLAVCYIQTKDWIKKTFTNDEIPCEMDSSCIADEAYGYGTQVSSNSIGLHLDSLMLDALDGFLVYINNKGVITYVSSNVHDHIGLKQTDVFGKQVLSLIHADDHRLFANQFQLRKPSKQHQRAPSSNTGAVQIPKHEGEVDHFQLDRKRSFHVQMCCNNAKPGMKTNQRGYLSTEWSGRLQLSQDRMKQMKCSEDAFLKNPLSYINGLLAVVRAIHLSPILELQLEANMYLSRHTMDMKYLFCDARIDALLGYEPNEMIGQTCYQFSNPIDGSKLLDCHSNLIEKGTSMSKYYRILNKQGFWIWMKTRATIVYNESHDPQYIVCLNYVYSEEEGRKYQLLEEKQETSSSDTGVIRGFTTHQVFKETLEQRLEPFQAHELSIRSTDMGDTSKEMLYDQSLETSASDNNGDFELQHLSASHVEDVFSEIAYEQEQRYNALEQNGRICHSLYAYDSDNTGFSSVPNDFSSDNMLNYNQATHISEPISCSNPHEQYFYHPHSMNLLNSELQMPNLRNDHYLFCHTSPCINSKIKSKDFSNSHQLNTSFSSTLSSKFTCDDMYDNATTRHGFQRNHQYLLSSGVVNQSGMLPGGCNEDPRSKSPTEIQTEILTNGVGLEDVQKSSISFADKKLTPSLNKESTKLLCRHAMGDHDYSAPPGTAKKSGKLPARSDSQLASLILNSNVKHSDKHWKNNGLVMQKIPQHLNGASGSYGSHQALLKYTEGVVDMNMKREIASYLGPDKEGIRAYTSSRFSSSTQSAPPSQDDILLSQNFHRYDQDQASCAETKKSNGLGAVPYGKTTYNDSQKPTSLLERFLRSNDPIDPNKGSDAAFSDDNMMQGISQLHIEDDAGILKALLTGDIDSSGYNSQVMTEDQNCRNTTNTNSPLNNNLDLDTDSLAQTLSLDPFSSDINADIDNLCGPLNGDAEVLMETQMDDINRELEEQNRQSDAYLHYVNKL